MASQILADLDAQVTASTTVMGSASTLIKGIAGRIQAAVDAAVANGATAAELEPVKALVTALNTSSADLSQAVIDNTPGGPVVTPDPV